MPWKFSPRIYAVICFIYIECVGGMIRLSTNLLISRHIHGGIKSCRRVQYPPTMWWKTSNADVAHLDRNCIPNGKAAQACSLHSPTDNELLYMNWTSEFIITQPWSWRRSVTQKRGKPPTKLCDVTIHNTIIDILKWLLEGLKSQICWKISDDCITQCLLMTFLTSPIIPVFKRYISGNLFYFLTQVNLNPGIDTVSI